MLRWIGGCAVVLAALLAIGIWTGYRKVNSMAEEGPEERVTIHAPAARVFAMVANGDSLPAWRMEGSGVSASRAGMLQLGDSIVVQPPAGANRVMHSAWQVSALVPNALIAFQMRSDAGALIATRRDSLAAFGDSTLVVSSIVGSMPDPGGAQPADSGGAAVGSMTAKLFLTAGRMQTRAELQRLKTRLEGDSTASPPRR